jgi:chloramphenicol-sensitive protein RarD
MGENKTQITAKNEYAMGMTAAMTCSVVWGLLPIYWQALRPIDSFVIIFYRIFLVALVCLIASLKTYGWKGIVAPLRIKGLARRYFIAGLVITGNWSLYIWAVNADYVIQTSIGYYLEPLIVCVFGILLFKEKVTGHKKVAFVLASLGIVVLLIHFGELPFVALGLAFSFALYAAIKKSYRLEALLSLLYETMFLAIPALGVIIYLEIQGKGALGVGEPHQYVLLLLTGVITVIPLGLFAVGINRLPLVTMGIVEYIAPSITLLIGIYLFKEPFDQIQFLAFVIIWIGLVFFTIGERKEYLAGVSDEK